MTMIDETGKEIGITELEKEENKEDNNLSFDSIDVTSKKEDNSKISSTLVTEPEEETGEEVEEEFEEEFDEEPSEEDLFEDEMKGDEE